MRNKIMQKEITYYNSGAIKSECTVYNKDGALINGSGEIWAVFVFVVVIGVYIYLTIKKDVEKKEKEKEEEEEDRKKGITYSYVRINGKRIRHKHDPNEQLKKPPRPKKA